MQQKQSWWSKLVIGDILEPKAMQNTMVMNIVDGQEREFQNGLLDAIQGFTPGGIGTEVNQTTTLFINLRYYLVSNQRQLLSQAYAEQGIVQTIVNVPVDDAMRGGVKVKDKQLSPEEIEELQAEVEMSGDLGVAGLACKWNRLFGGGGILILTDQDPKTPLDWDAIGETSNLAFRAVDMWELFYDKQNVEGFNPAIEDPQFDFYNYYGRQIHKTRVMKLKGLEAPSFIRPRLRGWGLSVVECLVNSINKYLKTNNVVFEILDEFKVDYYKIKNLTDSLFTDDGTNAARKRIQAANWQKNYQNAVVMDSEDDHDSKQLSFAGLADIPKEGRIQIASDMRMPLTKIFGISAAGFSSGEDDIENYNAMVESTVRTPVKPYLILIYKLRAKKKFGYVPENLMLEFEPLRILSSEQQENVKTQRFNRLIQARTANEITVKEFRDGCNKGQLLEVQLDTTIDELELKPQEVEGAGNKDDSQEVAPAKAPVSKKRLAKEAV